MASQFFWYELLTTDLDRSLAFFAGLFDCEVLVTEEQPPAYFVAPKGTNSPLFGVLGIVPGEGVRSHWVGYLRVDDLDKAVALTEEAGGTLHAISDDEEGRTEGDPRYAIVTDPEGAVINLNEGVTLSGNVASVNMTEEGRLAWIELLTTDREGAADYYANLAGWEVGEPFARGEEGVAHKLASDGQTFGIMRDLQPGSPVPSHWTFFLRVSDLDRAIAYVRANGGFMYEDPAPVEGGRRVLMLDPTGAPVALWAPQ